MNQLSWEKKHQKRIAGYVRQIDEIFTQAAQEAAAIGALFNANDLFSQPFSFKDYPMTKQRVDQMMQGLHKGISTVVVNGATAEWKQSNLINDEIAMRVLGIKDPDQIPDKFRKYFNNNAHALNAFLQRKEIGLNLSDRVWKYTDAFKQEIELGLDLGIRAGKPASEMARDLKQYLREPNRLFRRVRDQHGNLQLSRAARAYHPGRGVYRSSYKNAMRLTRTETNMAYRTANHTRMQQLDFVVGFEVRLTNNPAHVYDICDELKGRYPKDFKFVGWHPHCMCHAITILKTPEELGEDINRIQAGEPTTNDSKNKVEGLPHNFKDWAERNRDRIATAKAQPYFIRDNFKGTDVTNWFAQQPVAPAAAAFTAPVKLEIPMPAIQELTDEQKFLQEFNKIENPKTTPEQLLKDQAIKKELKNAFGPKDEIDNWIENFMAKSKNMEPNIYHRYEGAGEGYAGMGNGLYMGRDRKALDAFYNQFGERELPLRSFRGEAKWLDIADPRRKKLWDDYLKKKGINPLNSDQIAVEVQKLGFDGIKYFDPNATGEEFVLFNTKALKRFRYKTAEQRTAIQKAWDERKEKLAKPAPKPAAKASTYKFNKTDFRKLREEGWKFTSSGNNTLEGFINTYSKHIGGFNIKELSDELTTIMAMNKITIGGKKLSFKGEHFELRVTGYIKNGETFTMVRSFRNTNMGKTVDHDLLVIPESLQGKDVTKKLFQSLYKQYQNADIQTIKVHANMDVGGYAWGRYGFTISNEGLSKMTRWFKSSLSRAELDDLQNTIAQWKKDHPRKERFPMRVIADKPYGKKALLESDWFGEIDLKDPHQRQVFEDYLYKGK